MDALQAAFMRTKQHHLEDWNARRRDVADRYRFLLEDVPEVTVLAAQRDGEPIYHLFVVQVNHREALKERLQAAGISTGVHYPIPLHRQAAFAAIPGVSGASLPVTEKA